MDFVGINFVSRSEEIRKILNTVAAIVWLHINLFYKKEIQRARHQDTVQNK